MDPYLFENFGTEDGDFLAAKFRAFKFPESTYVQFRGTVNVCVDKCHGVQCNNGQVGYGRKKRAVSASRADPNKVYEISMATFIRVNYDDKADKGAHEYCTDLRASRFIFIQLHLLSRCHQ